MEWDMPEKNLKLMFKIAEDTSMFSEESYVILSALGYRGYTIHQAMVTLSDSLTALKASTKACDPLNKLYENTAFHTRNQAPFTNHLHGPYHLFR